jgi:hypothetical protein
VEEMSQWRIECERQGVNHGRKDCNGRELREPSQTVRSASEGTSHENGGVETCICSSEESYVASRENSRVQHGKSPRCCQACDWLAQKRASSCMRFGIGIPASREIPSPADQVSREHPTRPDRLLKGLHMTFAKEIHLVPKSRMSRTARFRVSSMQDVFQLVIGSLKSTLAHVRGLV